MTYSELKLLWRSKLETIYDQDERIKVLMKIQETIADDAPYVWFNYKKEIQYGVADRIKREVDTLSYSIGRSYWSFKSANRKMQE